MEDRLEAEPEPSHFQCIVFLDGITYHLQSQPIIIGELCIVIRVESRTLQNSAYTMLVSNCKAVSPSFRV